MLKQHLFSWTEIQHMSYFDLKNYLVNIINNNKETSNNNE